MIPKILNKVLLVIGATSTLIATTAHGAIYLDGLTGKVTIPSNVAYDRADPDPVTDSGESFTVECWFKTTATTQGTIIHRMNDGEALGFRLVLEADGQITQRHATNNAKASKSNLGANLNDGQWHHLALVINAGGAGASNVETIIDGVVVDTYTHDYHNYGWGTGTPSNFVQDVVIGYHQDTGYFEGNIKNVRIWRQARTVAEITADMNKEVPDTNVTNLEANFLLNETTGTTAADAVAANDATISGGAYWSASTGTNPPIAVASYEGFPTYFGVHNFTTSDFRFVDADKDSLASVTISNISLATDVEFKLNGVDVINGQTIVAADIANLSLMTMDAGVSTFDFAVNDATDNGVVTVTMTVTVTDELVWTGFETTERFPLWGDNDSSHANAVTLSEGNTWTFTNIKGYNDYVGGSNGQEIRMDATGAMATVTLGVQPTVSSAGTLTFDGRRGSGSGVQLNVEAYDPVATTWVVLKSFVDYNANPSNETVIIDDVATYNAYRLNMISIRNTADTANGSTHFDNIVIRSDNPLTPVIGLQIGLEGTVLTWSAEQEIGVAEYQVQQLMNDVWTTVEVLTAGAGRYETLINPAYDVRLVVVDQSGFVQSFFPDLTGKARQAYTLNAGWNLLSLPLADADLTDLLGAVDGQPMIWNGSAYEIAEALNAGDAFFVYASEAVDVTISGTRSIEPLVLNSGWNLTGVTENQQAPAEASIIYTLDASYDEVTADDLLIEGVGYWIYAE